MKPLDDSWSVSQAVEIACLLEASSPKIGNVHPGASFADMHFGHFVSSAAAVAPLFENIQHTKVGRLILDCVTVTRERVGRNTNLGTLLLLAPLAVGAARVHGSGESVSRERLQQSARKVLFELDSADSQDVYSAIRAASPGGLGERAEHDVRFQAPPDLVSAMQQVAGVDAVARQYVNGFEDIFERLWPWLLEALDRLQEPLKAIAQLQLRWLAHEPDGLIVRKLGIEEGKRIQRMAEKAYQLSLNGASEFQSELQLLDHFLRESGHIRNPGTTADLIAATLFCQLVVDKHGSTSPKG